MWRPAVRCIHLSISPSLHLFKTASATAIAYPLEDGRQIETSLKGRARLEGDNINVE